MCTTITTTAAATTTITTTTIFKATDFNSTLVVRTEQQRLSNDSLGNLNCNSQKINNKNREI